ncbi:Gfo/Idh/MocA family protein [Virgibacillus sp. W0430]|uniref:Gfo/Idh/MocA family protein n=1 Tax=Virgibacillus sp. W0430 TaxID=3391580 RepID=UPI003F48ABBB
MHNIGIVGTGLIAYSHADAIKSIQNATLTAAVDIDKEKVTAFSEKYNCAYYTDVKEMFESAEIDIVIICLPTYLHEEYVSLCATYGKHILCEKPVEMTLDATKRMLDNVKKAKVIFMVGQVVRFWSGYTEIKEMYESGKLGNVYMAFASRCSSLPDWGNWLLDPKKGAGAIQDMHVHDVDFLRYVFGEMDYVYCHANKDETGCWNHAVSSIAFKNGAKAVAEASFTMPDSYPFTMFFKVAGTKATVEFYYKAGENIGLRDSSSSEIRIYQTGEKPVIKTPESYDAYAKEIEYFLSCVEKCTQPEMIPHHESLEVIDAIESIRLSADTGEVVYLKPQRF